MPGIKSYLFENLPEEFRVVGLDKIRGGKEIYKLVASVGEALKVIRGEAAKRYKMPYLSASEGGLYTNDSTGGTVAVRHLFGYNLLLMEGPFDPISCARVYLEGDATSGVYLEAVVPGEYSNFKLVTKVAASNTLSNDITAAVTDTNADPFTVTLQLDPDLDWNAHATAINNAVGSYVRMYVVGNTYGTQKPTAANHGTTSAPKTRLSRDHDPGMGPGFIFKVGQLEVQNNTSPGNTNRWGQSSSYVGPWRHDYVRIAVNKTLMVDGKVIDSTAGVNLQDGAMVTVSLEIPDVVRLQLPMNVQKV